jgi:D-amino-acid dehydrogenase
VPSAIVLGAGMAGVSAALQLQSRGWSVALVDRKEPGLETSYGNAGIIQSEAVEPYAMPRDIATLLAIAAGRMNAVHYEPLALPRHVDALARYWWHSAPARHRRISAAYAKIIAVAASEHEKLIGQTQAQDLIRRDGFRVLHRSKVAMDEAVANAERLRADYGVAFEALSPTALAKAEPALIETGAGAIHWLAPWTVSDPGGLTGAYGHLFQQLGGTFAHGDADRLQRAASGGWRVAADEGLLEAEHAVVALGPWSPQLMRRFGYRFPMVRKRGYHQHYRLQQPLDLPLMDDAFGYVMAPMAKGLRITTGADLADDEPPLMPVQLQRAERAARDLLDLGAPVENRPWVGTRPCMPDMLPVVGAAKRQKNLWAHFGHGHQGFTLGPATGRMLAELMCGETPFVDHAPFRLDRYH